MKRGQLGLGLVIFAIVAIIAVIGLVLLFSRASAEGAAIGNVYGGGAPDISPYGDKAIASYHPQAKGIAETYASPMWTPPAPGAPAEQYPAYSPTFDTKGSRTPLFIVRKVEGDRTGYASLEDIHGCNQDLVVGAKFGNVQNYCSWYSVPVKSGNNAKGFYPPDSSAEARLWEGRQGGDMYCYARSTGAEQQVPNYEDRMRDTIRTTLVEGAHGVSKYTWSEVEMNGIMVPVCWVSMKTFPFSQGRQTY